MIEQVLYFFYKLRTPYLTRKMSKIFILVNTLHFREKAFYFPMFEEAICGIWDVGRNVIKQSMFRAFSFSLYFAHIHNNCILKR